VKPALTSPLQESIAILGGLRKELEHLLPSVDWTTRCHADAEVLAFMQLAYGNVAAVETLAKRDARFVVPGTAAARAAYEAVITAAWLVWTPDLGERDRRWLSLFVDEENFWKVAIREATARKDSQAIIDGLTDERERVARIIAEVSPQLAAIGVGPAKPMPTFDQRLAQVGQSHYVVYKTACQIVHPSTRGLSLVRDLLAAHSNDIPVASYGYRTTDRNWTTAVLLGAESIWFGLETLATWMHGPPVSPRATDLFNAVVSKVRTFKGPEDHGPEEAVENELSS
jgi:hypothetical protein